MRFGTPLVPEMLKPRKLFAVQLNSKNKFMGLFVLVLHRTYYSRSFSEFCFYITVVKQQSFGEYPYNILLSLSSIKILIETDINS